MIEPLKVRAVMQRRILLNYRVDEDAAAAVLPVPFRPLLVAGHAIAGMCLIRLGQIRPSGLPGAFGMTTENAAHRIAVQWDTVDGPVAGVYIPRRDTGSRLTSLAGGRVFPGYHHRSRFDVAEGDEDFRIRINSIDGQVEVLVSAHMSDRTPAGSVFADAVAASRFFGCAPVGYSPRPGTRALDGVRLDCDGWNLQPLAVEQIRSSYLERSWHLPPDLAAFDSAFLMRGLDTTWTALPPLLPGA